MQTASYTVNSGGGVALWRGIPAQITISGIEDVSGDWLFLVDNDLADGVVLSGTVAADGETLVVTLAEMNTVELAEAIQGRSILQCRATLTDGVSRVYIIPLAIRNRAMDGQPPPTPVAEYYTKAQIDAMISGQIDLDYTTVTNKPQINGVTLAGNKTAADLGLAIPSQIPPAQVQSNWNETDNTSKAYIQNKPVIPSVPVQSVNGKTGAVNLNAADVGAVSKDGLPIVSLEAGTIPAPGAVYTFTPSTATEFAFPTPVAGKDNAFRLVLTMPDPAVAVTFPAGLTWKFATPAMAAGTTSELAFAWTGSAWEGWAVPDMIEYELKADSISRVMDLGVPLSSSGAPINITNNNSKIISYRVSGSVGIFDIGDTDYNTFYTRIYGVYARIYGSNSITLSATSIEFSQYGPNLSIIVNGKTIYDITTTGNDFTLPANLSVAGSIQSAGQDIITPATTTIAPQDNKVYKHLLAASDAIAFDLTSLTSTHQVNFEVHLIQPATAVTFTLPAGVWWAYGDAFASGNAAPTLDTANTEYCLVFRWNGENLLGNLAYSKEVTA